MRRHWTVTSAVAVALIAVTCSIRAKADDAMMCGNALVSVGMVASEIAARCGQPRSKESEDVPIRVRHTNGTVGTAGVQHIERWTYDRGYGKFPALLTFDQGKLRSIELLTRP